ncbi:glycosyltransferase [Rubritalea spongiae]|uniref:Glycosyltransferase n=1 Tax=Rubritalea spongiae TaxID=430797 RepID=A0ABW5E5I7_9BACT
MRIEFVSDTFPPDINGVAMTLGRLTQCLKERGHYVHVIHTGEQCESGQTVKQAVSLPGYKEVRVGLPSPIKLRKRWKRKRPDAIYVATESPLGVSAIKAAKEMGIPVAAGFHTNFHQYFSKYKIANMEKPAMSYLKNVHAKAHMTMAPSQDAVKMLEKEGFSNVKLLGRGVDVNLFNPDKRSAELRAEWGAKGDSPVVIIVGRLAAEKNLDFAMQLVAEMSLVEPKLQVVVVGDGPMREVMEAKHEGVHFVGVKQGEELARCYASADILLFPSETETFGNVLLEGMASGLVTVSYNYAASSLYIEHGENGLHAAFGDAEEFQELAVQSLSVVGDGRIAKKAIDSIKGQSWEKVTSDFERHLEEMILTQPVTQRRVNKRCQLKLRSLFISDVHLGTSDSKAREVVEVLKAVKCERIYLNGDIIDGWALSRGSKWKKSHTKVLRCLLKKMEKEGTEVIYIRGNHDDFLEKILPFEIGGIKIVKECVHEAVGGERYLVVHGDGFDSVSTNHKWVANVGAVGYDFLLRVNRFYNYYRRWRGKDYFSLSKAVKAKVKSAVSFVDSYEEKLQELAVLRQCHGIICGHIHTPADKMIGDRHYLNSGDWVETLSCIFEHSDGKFEVVHYDDLLGRLEIEPRENSEATDELEEHPFTAFSENSDLAQAAAKQALAH